MALIKNLILILALFAASGVQASSTVFSGAAVTMGANSKVHGDLQAASAVTLGATAVVTGDLAAGAAVTLGATSTVGGSLSAADGGTIGAGSIIGRDLTTGGAVTLGATTTVGENLKAGAAILVGVKSEILGSLTSGAAAAVGLGAGAFVGVDATAGTALTLGAGARVVGNACGTPLALGAGASHGIGINVDCEASQENANSNAIISLQDKKAAGIAQKVALSELQENLAGILSIPANELDATLSGEIELTPGAYHATALTTAAGTTLTFKGDTEIVGPDTWLVNVDTFIAFGANLIMELDSNVKAGSTIIFNAGGYTTIGADSKIIGDILAGSYINTGAGTRLTGINNADNDATCGSMSTISGAVTLGAGNILGTASCLSVTPNFEFVFAAVNVMPAPSGNASDAGAPVDLGRAGDFAILAKTGISRTNAAGTLITGDIGVSPIARTAITGFSDVLDSTNVFSKSIYVVGDIYAADMAPPTPSNMTTVISDMETAYTDAAGRSPTATELGAGEIGGMDLVAGVYKWGTDVSINGSHLTLTGSATDVWIFQISGNFTQASGLQVILGDAAQAKNVFWQVGGVAGVTLDTTASLQGIVLSAKAIVVRTGATVNGRLLSQTAVTLDANVVTEPPAT